MESSIDLYPEERQQRILTMLNQNGRASITELSQIFRVSEVTVRADLQTLAAQNLILRTHGGTVLDSRARSPELSLMLHRQQHVHEKKRIGAAAAIFLDASSTALALAHHLQKYRDLTILTHSLVVAQVMLYAPGVTVAMTGGIVHRDTLSLLGTDVLAILKKYNLKISRLKEYPAYDCQNQIRPTPSP